MLHVTETPTASVGDQPRPRGRRMVLRRDSPQGQGIPVSRPARGADVADEADGVETPPPPQPLPRLQA